MLKIALSGCNGRMGHVIADIVSTREGMEIVAGFDINTASSGAFPVFDDPFAFDGACDVIDPRGFGQGAAVPLGQYVDRHQPDDRAAAQVGGRPR